LTISLKCARYISGVVDFFGKSVSERSTFGGVITHGGVTSLTGGQAVVDDFSGERGAHEVYDLCERASVRSTVTGGLKDSLVHRRVWTLKNRTK